MIDIAQKYKADLAKLFLDNWSNPRLMFWNSIGYNRSPPEIPDTDWNGRYFVVKNEDRIIGYVSYEINTRPNSVCNLEAVNFYEAPNDRVLFGFNLFKILKDIFDVYKHNKINFFVTVGNPVEKSYDKMVAKFGGRVVGIYKEDAKLMDGEMYDLKAYEILRSEYLKRNPNKH